MSDLLPDFDDRENTLTLLLLAEILSKRGELSPLSRVFACRPKAKPSFAKSPEGPGDDENEGR